MTTTRPEQSEAWAQSKGNPFGIAPAPREYFIGRDGALDRIHQLIKLRKVPMGTLVSVPGRDGSGKTSFLEAVGVLAKENALAYGFLTSVRGDSSPQQSPADKLTRMAESPSDTYFGYRLVRTACRAVDQIIADEKSPSQELTRRLTEGAFPFDSKPSGPFSVDCIIEDLQYLIGELQGRTRARGLLICLDEAQELSSRLLKSLKLVSQHLSGLVIVTSWLVPATGPYLEEEFVEMVSGRAVSRQQDQGVLEVFTHTVIPMEPLSATESEAALAVRLEDCNRTFSDEVIRPIVDVSGGHPRRLMKLANFCYEAAGVRSSSVVTLDDFGTAMRDVFPDLSGTTSDLVASRPVECQLALQGLVELNNVATSRAIADRLSGKLGTARVTHDSEIAAVRSELVNLAEVCPHLNYDRADDKFSIVSQPVIWAVKFALMPYR